MAETVKVSDAKTHLSELLARVEAGEEFVIARGQEPVARLERAARETAFDEMIATRDSGRIKRVSVDELIAWKHEGHQY